MDRLSLMIGNGLVGNDLGAAGLELCLPPAVIRFDADCFIALTGAECRARLDGVALDSGCSATAKSGMTLEFAAAASGARAYLCVAGGIDVPLVLGSRSTDLHTAMGGFQGRMIRRGDVLNILPSLPRKHMASRTAQPLSAGPIRVMAGPEFEEFDPQSRKAFFESRWRVTPQSNRMGYRLEGPTLARMARYELKSHAVFCGLIQVPPGGAPIALMADAHATGGYPRFAMVIAADHGRLAQVAPGGSIQFELCTRKVAVQELRSNLHAH